FGAAAGSGSLSEQDIDNDGDIDLLWKEALAPYPVMLWLNDGAGYFECLCPSESQDRQVTLGGSGMSTVQSRTLDRIVSSERLPPPGHMLAASWDRYAPVLSWKLSPAPVRGLFIPLCPLTTRGPPLVRC